MPSKDYWGQRAIGRLEATEAYTATQAARTMQVYSDAYREIDGMIADIYRAYGRQVGLDPQALRTLLSINDTEKGWAVLERLGLTGYVRDNYKARITRLEAMQHQLYGRAKEVAAKETGIATQAFGAVLQGNYGATLRDYGAAAFAQLDDRTIGLVLRTPFQGSNYSQRIWGNTDALAEKVSGLLGRGAATGESLPKLTREVREAFDVSKGQAERLMRTESNHFHNEAEALAYEDMGVERYVFMATLGGDTCGHCGDLDGKAFKVSERSVGENYPPLHPNCRCTTIADLDDALKPTVRRARNPETGESEVVGYTTYNDWQGSGGQAAPASTGGEQLQINQLGKPAMTVDSGSVFGEGKQTAEYMDSRGFATHNMAGGYRTPPGTMLSEADIERINGMADSINIPRDILRFNEGSATGYDDNTGLINIRGDIMPDNTSRKNRDTMSERAVLAHEYYGHAHFGPSKYAPNTWQDEYRASAYAALNTPGLLPEERRALIIDAYERADESGIVLRKTSKVKDMIYGRMEE